MTPEGLPKRRFLRGHPSATNGPQHLLRGRRFRSNFQRHGLPAIHTDIIEPGSPTGLQKNLAGGISLAVAGAWNAKLICWARLMAFASRPYPGSALTADAIETGRGLARWQNNICEELTDPRFASAAWLQQRLILCIPVFIGRGREDRFAKARWLRKSPVVWPRSS